MKLGLKPIKKKQKLKPKSNKRFKGSIKNRLATFLVLMAIIPLMVMGVVVTYISKDSVSREIQDKASIIVDNLNDNIDLFIEQNKNLVGFLATTKAVRTMDQSQISSFLYDIAQQNPQILRMYVANIEDKTTFAVPFATFSDDFDLDSEEWYTGALDAKGNYISNVRVDPMSGNSIISISNIILSDIGEPIGVVSADVSLVSLTRIVMNMNVGEEGYSFVTDKNGYVIAHKEYSQVKAHENYSDYEFMQEP